MPELPLTGVSKKLHYPLRIFAIHPPLEEVGVFLQKIDKLLQITILGGKLTAPLFY
jgi:hypothetical protein